MTSTTTEISVPQAGPRFLIGGFMLAVMAAWVYANHDPAPIGIVALLGVAAALAVVLGVAGLRDQSGDGIAAARRSGLVAFLIAVVAAVCVLWLTVQYQTDALGESFGLAIFAVLAFASGVQDRSFGLSSDELWAKIQSQRPVIGFGLATLGALSIGTFFYLAMVQKIGTDYAPELIGLMLGGFILFFAGLYLVVSKDPPPEIETLRLFGVILGSLLGGIVTLVSLARAFLWSDDIFRSDVSVWSGSRAYRFWLVAYLFLTGMGLIFAGLGLSMSQVRSNQNLRRATFGYGNVILGVFLFLLLLFTNIFVSIRARYTFDWSQTRGISALNAGSQSLLAGLTEPTNVYVLMSPDGRIFNDLRNFMGNCQAYNSKIAVNYIDPDHETSKYNALANRFKEIVSDMRSPMDDEGGRGVLIVYGTLPEDIKQSVPHIFIPQNKLFEVDRRSGPNKEKLVLKAESEIIRELAFLAKKNDRRKIYLLQGDDALDMNVTAAGGRQNPSSDIAGLGAGNLVEKIKKESTDVRGISFGIAPADKKAKDIDYLGSASGDKKIDIPDDCDVLILPGPSAPIERAGLDAMERYMDRGGKMIVALDVVADQRFASLRKTGLEEFLKKYGVDVTDQVLYRLPKAQDQAIFGRDTGDYRLVLAQTPPKAATVLAKQFQRVPFRWWSVRVVKPGTSTKYQVEPLLVVDPKRPIVWADESLAGLVDFERYTGELIRTKRLDTLYTTELLPVAVTVTERVGETVKPRMVVFGDAEFLDNEDIAAFSVNYDLIASSLEWMSERTFIGPGPKESSRYSFGPDADTSSMLFGAFWTMLVLTMILGVGVWLTRRK